MTEPGRGIRSKPAWLEKIFPWPQQSAIVNGRRMAFVDEGPRDGLPVLLLSGQSDLGLPLPRLLRPTHRRRLSRHRARLGGRRLLRSSARRLGAHAGAPRRRSGGAARSPRPRPLRHRRSGLGRAAGRRRRAPARRAAARAGADEHLVVHRLRRRLPLVAAPVDDLARAAHRSVLDEAGQGAVAARPVGADAGAA